jgi:predicted NAD/FAD-dependent oxidoreductase
MYEKYDALKMFSLSIIDDASWDANHRWTYSFVKAEVNVKTVD